MNDLKNKIEALKAQLKKWDYEYYALETPTVDDSIYDQTMRELNELEQQNPSLKTDDSPTNRVGGYVSSKFDKVKHEIPMLSLGNAFDFNDMIKFDEDIKKSLNVDKVEYIVEPKIDGLSISLKYKDGFLIKAITRGDGEIGEDVTVNAKTIKSIPLAIDFKGEIEIRGEVFINKKNFEIINQDPSLVKPFANARNAASGSLRNLESSITAKRKLSGLFYYVPENNKINKSKQSEILNWLKEQKIPVSNEILVCSGVQEVIERIKFLTETRDKFNYDIDGIVIKVNDINNYEEIGYTSKFPKWAIAYKFPASYKKTKILSIITTVGRTGKITLVANVEPVELNSTTVTKATLHNYDYIKEKDIRVNDSVSIYKAGDIIPKIHESFPAERSDDSRPFEEPKVCPSCNAELIKIESEVDHYCLNEECEEKNIQKIAHFVSRDAMNIDGLSEMSIRKLYRNNIVKKIEDLYQIEKHADLIQSLNLSMKEKTIKNLINSINNSKSNSLEKLLFGLGIKHVGFNVAKQIAKRFKSIENIIEATNVEIESVGDVGEKIVESIISWFQKGKNIDTVKSLGQAGVNFKYQNEFNDAEIKAENKIFLNKNFVITGSFETPRHKIKELVESLYESKLSSTVTKNTDFLIIGKNPTQSKIEKAKLLNVKIIETNFWKDYYN